MPTHGHVKRVFPQGDGRCSSGSPVPAPRGPGPDISELRAGHRVWVFRGGQWTDARFHHSRRDGYVYVSPLGAAGGGLQWHQLKSVALHQPYDCGAMVPPQAVPGMLWWLQHDASVFANVHGVGASVPRPSCLWVASEAKDTEG